MPEVQVGLYENLITKCLGAKLSSVADRYYIGDQPIDPSEAALRLSSFISRILFTVLESLPHDEDRLEKQIQLSNDLLKWLCQKINDPKISENISEDFIDTRGKILTAIFSKIDPVASDLASHVNKITPISGLTQSELFTGNRAGISMESEIKREILSADSICWLVSFIKWYGIRIFKDELEEFTQKGKKLRVITTSYMGATDLKAVEFLASLPNAEVKISYNTGNERLHAKSYLFLRDTGLDTGYIGSSNISRTALTNGLEWNMKVTTREIPHIIEKFKNTFETYWASNEFEFFRHGENACSEKFRKALYSAKNKEIATNEIALFDIEPHVHQKEILEKLTIERERHNRWKNLIVAATGTGKTIISAFDFRRYYNARPDAKLLFVAHRKEILEQAMARFRGVLRRNNFGDLWVGSYKPERYDHLFASVQMLNNNLNESGLSPEYYDFIIFDEVHHVAADSYRPIISYFKPKILLGLTATPDRHDGSDILGDFCDTIAADLRLPDAISRRYLCPFQYFGIDDETDISKVSWKKGHYDPSELTNIYTSNDRRCLDILRNLEDIVGDISNIKALAFCVSQEHAKFMAEKFLMKNIKAAVLTSDNSHERDDWRTALQNGQINVLFVVDIFNEGIDIPEIDTVLFLRPTESLTIFLQQLGRGLRLAEGKDCLTVLDFVGNARPEYDFAQKFRAVIGKSHISIADEIESDFPHLPLGCSIKLQKKAKEIILRNIKSAIVNKNKIVNYIRRYSENTNLPLTIKNFLYFHPDVKIENIYKINDPCGWTHLSINAGAINKTVDENLAKCIRKGIFNRLLPCTSASYMLFIKNLINNKFQWDQDDPVENQMATMLHYDFWDKSPNDLGFSNLVDSLKALGNDENLTLELSEAIEYILDSISITEMPMKIKKPVALCLHARYGRDQILSAFGKNNNEKKYSSREGVLELKKDNIELLFVTLKKSDRIFSPTTLYHDYAISETLFHWQSQNSAVPEKGRGRSYLEQGKNGKEIILFVREQNNDEYGRTMGFVNLGPVDFDSFDGRKPMNIIWRLRTPLPPWFWDDAAKLSLA